MSESFRPNGLYVYSSVTVNVYGLFAFYFSQFLRQLLHFVDFIRVDTGCWS
jgi:hypothetical protein